MEDNRLRILEDRAQPDLKYSQRIHSNRENAHLSSFVFKQSQLNVKIFSIEDFYFLDEGRSLKKSV